MSDQALLETALGRYVEPLLGRDLQSAGVPRTVSVDGNRARVQLTLGFPVAGYRAALAAQGGAAPSALPRTRTSGTKPPSASPIALATSCPPR